MPFQICTYPKLLLVRTTHPSKCSLSFHICRSEFLTVRTIDIWGQIILFWQAECPGYCEAFSSIPGLYRLDISSPAPELWLPNDVMEKPWALYFSQDNLHIKSNSRASPTGSRKVCSETARGAEEGWPLIKSYAYKQHIFLTFSSLIKEKSASPQEVFYHWTTREAPSSCNS